jgi:ATP-dependent RNA helicase DHX57
MRASSFPLFWHADIGIAQVPLYALLLFGGPVSVNHVAGGLTVGTKTTYIKLKAWPRIGVLVNQLR